MDACPKCEQEMNVFTYFWQVIVPGSNTPEFEYTCENCGAVLMIEVEATPIFVIREKKHT